MVSGKSNEYERGVRGGEEPVSELTPQDKEKLMLRLAARESDLREINSRLTDLEEKIKTFTGAAEPMRLKREKERLLADKERLDQEQFRIAKFLGGGEIAGAKEVLRQIREQKDLQK